MDLFGGTPVIWKEGPEDDILNTWARGQRLPTVQWHTMIQREGLSRIDLALLPGVIDAVDEHGIGIFSHGASTVTPEAKCPICLDAWGSTPDNQVVTLLCGHAFHSECLKFWCTRHQSKCPMCRGVPATAAIESVIKAARHAHEAYIQDALTDAMMACAVIDRVPYISDALIVSQLSVGSRRLTNYIVSVPNSVNCVVDLLHNDEAPIFSKFYAAIPPKAALVIYRQTHDHYVAEVVWHSDILLGSEAKTTLDCIVEMSGKRLVKLRLRSCFSQLVTERASQLMVRRMPRHSIRPVAALTIV